MKKKILKGVLGAMLILSFSTLSSSCGGLFKTNGSISGIFTPNISPDLIKNPPGGVLTNLSEEEGDYVVYHSGSSSDFLKPNNKYLFKKLTFNPLDLDFKNKPEVYNNKQWVNYLPKIFLPLAKLASEQDSIPIAIKDLIAINPESAVEIWEILRNFTNKENGIVKGALDSSLDQTYIRFLEEMKSYLTPPVDQSTKFWKLKHDKDSINSYTDLSKHMYRYWEDSWAFNSGSYIDAITIHNPTPKTKEIGDSIERLHLLKNEVSGSWSITVSGGGDTELSKSYFLPFTRGQNPQWKKRFPNATKDFYADGNVRVDSGVKLYSTWNLMIGIPWTILRFQYNESNNLTMFLDLVKFYLAMANVNKGAIATKWSEINEATKADFKNAANRLTDSILQVLDWKNLLGMEMENPDDRKSTITHLFPVLDKYDLEHNWVFAYKFLYEVLVPLYGANGWEMPPTFKLFDIQMSDKSFQSHYVYKFALNYLNTIFKHQDKNFKQLEIKENVASKLNDISMQAEYKKTFFDYLISWSAKLGINIIETEL